jgi:chromosome segregation ATPase|uniref:BHLH domain-containing protein n=1 Tax=Panagrolaimus davidi TaxID=227884 RepID=A0A914NZ43_9BILA
MSYRHSDSENEFSDTEIDIETTSPNGENNGIVSDHKKHARAQHNALERRRRDNIKDMYSSLKDEIPNFNHERASRAQILSKTIEQMQFLQREADDAEKEMKEAEEENARLLKELEELDAAEASCRTTPERTLYDPNSNNVSYMN